MSPVVEWQRSVEIFPGDNTVNVCEVPRNLDERMARRLRCRVLYAHAEGRLDQAHFMRREHLATDPSLPLFGHRFFRRRRLGSFVRRRE